MGLKITYVPLIKRLKHFFRQTFALKKIKIQLS